LLAVLAMWSKPIRLIEYREKMTDENRDKKRDEIREREKAPPERTGRNSSQRARGMGEEAFDSSETPPQAPGL
jgi:hypothetical protein